MKIKKFLLGLFLGMGLIFTMQTILSFADFIDIPLKKSADGTVVQISEEEYEAGPHNEGESVYKINYLYYPGDVTSGAMIKDGQKLSSDKISPREITINVNGKDITYIVTAVGAQESAIHSAYTAPKENGVYLPQTFTIPDSIKKIFKHQFWEDYSDNYSSSGIATKVETKDENENILGTAYYVGTKDNPYYALVGCDTSSTRCDIHEDTKIIAHGAFQSCNNLVKVTVPDGIQRVDEQVFANYMSYTYAPTNLQFNQYGNCSYLGNDENPYLVLVKCNYTSSSPVTEAIIHKDTKIIAGYAFYSCKKLKYLHVGDGTNENPRIIEEAEEYEFKLPEGLRCIGGHAFESCYDGYIRHPNDGSGIQYDYPGLQKIVIPETVTEIGEYVFSSCSGLESVTLPESLTTIPSGLFKDCKSLYKVNSDTPGEIILPSGVKEVGSGAFSQIGSAEYRGNLVPKNVVIPEGVTTIGSGVFNYCNTLEQLVLPTTLETVAGDIFKIVPSASKVANIFIPEGATIPLISASSDQEINNLLVWEYKKTETSSDGKTVVEITNVTKIPKTNNNQPAVTIPAQIDCDFMGGDYVINEVDSTVSTEGGQSVAFNQHVYDGYGFDGDGHWKACSECGLKDPDSTKKPHQYSDEITYTWSGDNRKCTAMRPCTICGYEEKETVDSTNVTTDPTCTQDGNIVYTATFTNEAFAEQTKDVTITAPGHVWSDEWSTDENNHWHECTVCDDKKDEATHEWEWNKDEDNHWHKCTVCGAKKDEAAHTWDEEWSTNEDEHWHKCTTCGEIKDKDDHEFTYSYNWIKEENSKGNVWKYEGHAICNECQKTTSSILDVFVPIGYEPGENEFPDARIWQYTEDENGKATIVAKGNKEYFNYVEIPAKIGGDEAGNIPVVKIGEEAFSDCSNIEEVVIPPSVEVIGENAFQNCNSLGYIFVEKNVDISGAGITENVMIFRYEELTDETVPQDGLTHVKITSVENVNGEKFNFGDDPLEFPNFAMGENYLIDSIECCATETTSQWAEKAWNIYGTHNYNTDYTWADNYSTCTATGTCEHCGHEDSETVDTTSVIDTAPTCTEPGYGTFTATFTKGFETQVKSTYLPALGHNWKKTFGWEKKQTGEGDIWKLTTTRTCTVCGENESVGVDVFVPIGYAPGENEFPEARIWKYSVDLQQNHAIITGVDNSTLPDIDPSALSEITIPSRIGDEQEGYDIKAIADNAFESCNNMGPIVVVPPSVESIGNEAFKNCKNLMGVFAQKDTQIANDAFSGVSNDFILFRYDVLTGENVPDDGKIHVEITSIENADGTSVIDNFYGKPVSSENPFSFSKDIMGDDYVIDSFVYCAKEIEESGEKTWFVYGEHDWKTEYIWAYNEGTLTCTAKKICQNISSHTDEVGTITITGSSTYDGEPHGLEVTEEIPGTTLMYSEDGIIWSETSPTRTEVGTTTVYVKADGDENYATATITINAKSLTDDITIDPTAFIYDGAPKAPTVKDGETELTENVDYTAIYKDKDDNPIEKDSITELGKYKVVVTGIGNYSGEKEFEFEIYLLGDINGDDFVNILDLQMLYNHFARNIVLTNEQSIRADMNRNGSIEIADIPLLFNMISNN